MSRYFPALLLITAILLSGCGGGATPSKSVTGDVTAPSVSPSQIDFGNVTVGSSSTKTATLTAGTSPVTISSASWNGQGYSVNGISFPVTLPAGQSVSFTVTFTPQASGTIPGSISFISNASSPTMEALTGKGTGTESALHSVDLSWDPSPSSVGYNVYRGTTSGGPYPSKLNSTPQPMTSFVDNTVLSGTTYYYVATSVDANSVESSYSNQLTMAIP